MRIEPQVLEDPSAEAARRLAAAATSGGHVVITGGSTPRAAYERAAGLVNDWSSVELWFTDERCVPPDDEHSNFGMASRALLERLERPPAAVHRMEGELGPEEGARRHERELEASGIGVEGAGFDFVLLGLGPDAHICSLFPNDPALEERERPVAGVETAGMPPLVSRITLTLPMVNSAREVVFLVSGEDKAEAVARAFMESADAAAPASLVRPVHGRPAALLDPAAAGRLEAAL